MKNYCESYSMIQLFRISFLRQSVNEEVSHILRKPPKRKTSLPKVHPNRQRQVLLNMFEGCFGPENAEKLEANNMKLEAIRVKYSL